MVCVHDRISHEGCSCWCDAYHCVLLQPIDEVTVLYFEKTGNQKMHLIYYLSNEYLLASCVQC